MEIELTPRPCPFCGKKPTQHAYRDNMNRLTMFVISCYNEYCMVQPGIKMYGRDSQKKAVSYWNGNMGEFKEESWKLEIRL